MKKALFFILMLAIGLSAMAQQKIQLRSTDKAECVSSDMNSLRATFSFSTIEAEDYSSDRGTFSWISLPNTVLGGEVGTPQVPVINELIAVPYGATPRIEVTRYSTTDYSLEDYGMKTLVPRQLPVRKNQNLEDAPFVMNEDAYQTRGLRSEPHAAVSVDGTMRGVQLGKMTIDPVSYDPVSNTIRVFNDIEVMVHFDGADAQTTEKMLLKTYSPAFDAVYSQLFNNKAITDVYSDHPDLYNTPVRILVICYSGFRDNDALNTWLKWKLQKGYYVDIFYTDETGTTASAIASFIKTKYNASVSDGNAYTYLIVIGDTGQVPYYMVKNIDSSIGNCASDLGYSSVNFSSSTSNYFPDMYYSRISVENTTHLTNYINKVLTYEKYTFSDGGDYLNDVILVGGYDGTWTNRVAKPTINYATNYYFNSSNNTYGGFSGGTINATISTSSTQGYSGTNNGCYNGINNGACFLNYTAHGDKQEWQGPQFTAAQVATLTNTGKYFFGVGNCCLTGNFNNTTTSYSPGSSIGNNACFAEAMIRVPNAGAIAYIGCSPYSYWYEDFYWAVGAHSYSQGNYPTTSASSTGVYDAMFMDQNWNSASALLYLGNLAVQKAVSNGNQTSSITDGDCNNSAHYYFQFYHTFGDGSVMPYVTKPETNTVTIPSSVTSGANSVTINAVAGSYVAVTDNNSVIYGVAEANASGVANVVFTNAIPGSGTLYVVVTRQQYQPYFGTTQIVGGTPYNITCNQPQHGTINAPAQAYANTTVTLIANPETGYCLSSWNVRDANNNSITVTNNQFTMPSSNATVTATFVQGLQVTLAPVTNGSISAEPLYALQGMTINLTATAAQGYDFGNWVVYKTGDPNTTVTVNGNSFTMPNYPVTVSANFVLEPSELTVYNGTATNQYIPMYGYYFDDYTKSECIIPASQLTTMNGSTISAITFYPSSVNTSSWGESTQTVFLKEVTGTTLGGSYSGTTGATIVKTASPLDMPVAGTPYTITFDTPYSYNGGNLLIGVYNTDDGSYNKVEWYGTSNLTSGVSAYGYNGSNLNNVSYNAQSFLPKTTFTYTPASSPYLSLVPNSATMITGSTETLTATYGNVTGTPNITYTSSNTSVATVSGSGTTATVTAVTPGTATITATMTVNGTPYTATCAVTVETPSFCTPSFGSNTDCITNVTLGSINNTTASSSTNGYGDYTSMSTDLEAGTNVTLSLTSGSGSGTHAAAVWIDFDDSYSFETSERVGTQDNISASTTVNISLTIPDNVPVGNHRMRVVYQYNVSAANIDPCPSASYGEAEDYTVIITSSCARPTGLAISGITAHGVTASWNAEVGELFDYAMVSGANIDPATVTTYDGSITATGTTCSMSWNNLLASNDYTVIIRKNCGNNEYSNAISRSFITEAICPTPTNLTANNLTQSSASISWDGNADNYNVMYREATVTGTTLNEIFFDGFENGIGNWTTYASSYSNEVTNWRQYDATQFTSGTNYSGSYVAMSRSYGGSNIGDVSVDNWFVSPQMTLGDVVKFWVSGDDAGWQEYYAVYVSTETNAINDFVMLEAPELAPGDGTWSERTVNLGSYAGRQGYIAIRHTDSGKDYLLIDNFGVYGTVNTYSYGTEHTLTSATNSCNLTSLSAETLYEVNVQADCGSTDGTSNWNSMFITTPDACSAPTDLVSSNVTSNSVTLGWADNQDSYNIRYRKVYFHEDFENEALPTGWTTIDANQDGNTWSIGHATTHSGNNGTANISFIYNTTGTTPDDYLVSPLLDLQGTLRVWLSGFGDNNQEHFAIYVSTSGNSASNFTTTLVGETTTTNEYAEYTADLSSYAGQQGYIAIRHFNCTDQRYLYVDDFGLYGSENWITESANNATITLTGLTAETDYEWQVQGISSECDGGVTEWSEAAGFETEEGCPQITAADLPYNEGFENMTNSTEGKTGFMPTCWTLAYEDYAPMADTARPQVFYADNKPASGDYCLFMFGMGILAMPQLADDLDISTLKMSFALRQHKLITQLQVGVMSDLADETTFTPLATFDNGANTDVQHYVVDFRQYTGNDSPKYIAFRNILAPGYSQQRSVQYIDDISIYVANSADDPDPDHACGITVPYSQNFDNLTDNTSALTGVSPDCWTFSPDVTGAATPQVSFSPDCAASGNYSLYLSGKGIYAMPQITNATDLSGLTLTFAVRQRKYAHRIAVGVMTDPADPSTFVEIDRFYNGGEYNSPVTHSVNLARYSGSGLHIAFRNVSLNSDAVSQQWIDDISIDATPSVSCGITVPYEQGFENGIPDCWTFSPDLEGAAAPQISGEYASSGNNSLYMSGMGTFALPEITNVNDLSGLTLTFSVRQRKFAHRIAVGVMTDPSDPNTFVEIERIYNGGVYNMPVEHSVDLGAYSGNGRHIAFRNIVTNSNTVSQQWIDDISIDLTQARSAEVTQEGYETADNDATNEALAPLGVDDLDLNNLTVWPNPTTGALTLGMEAQRVEVSSLTGQKVAVFENTSRIDISNLPAGVYILKVTLPQGNAVRKIVKR